MTNWYDNIPAPVDANGRVVPLDTKELVYRGKTRKIPGITYNAHQKYWSVAFGWFDGVDISACTLPDSWEQLEKDTMSGLCEYFGMGDAEDCKGCPAYGDRLSRGCSSVMAKDIIRRAKALAGGDRR